jgi:hypothetical protein
MDFELFLLFLWFCRFSCRLLVLRLLLHLVVLRGVLDSRFNLCSFVVNGLIKGEIEKPSGHFLGLIVMSH